MIPHCCLSCTYVEKAKLLDADAVNAVPDTSEGPLTVLWEEFLSLRPLISQSENKKLTHHHQAQLTVYLLLALISHPLLWLTEKV